MSGTKRLEILLRLGLSDLNLLLTPSLRALDFYGQTKISHGFNKRLTFSDIVDVLAVFTPYVVVYAVAFECLVAVFTDRVVTSRDFAFLGTRFFANVFVACVPMAPNKIIL